MLTESDKIISWLLEGDPSIRWQVQKDLQNEPREIYQIERDKISLSGWGKQLLSYQDPSGMWGGGLYSPKWISTTYTLLLLRRLGLDPDNARAARGCELLYEKGLYEDGGINFWASMNYSETCVTGMVLSILSYFNFPAGKLEIIVDHLLKQQMKDGGWNCRSYKGATHSSFHTTISVLEGLREFETRSGYKSRQILKSRKDAIEFLLQHKLFRSHRTNRIIDSKMTRLVFPPRWRYDILRFLDFLRETETGYDDRMEEALSIIKKKKNSDGTWNLQRGYPGKVFFEMEKTGQTEQMEYFESAQSAESVWKAMNN